MRKLARNVLLLARRPDVVLRSRRYVLVLSHMRSYSSLLCHILGSHPEIDGYAEMHRSYRTKLDLLRLNAHVYRSLDGHLDGRLVLDKILHNMYSVDDTILESRRVYPIVLVRSPVPSLTSIMEMGKRIPSVSWYSDAALVTDYYERRLRFLAAMAERIDNRWLFMDGEQLVHETRASLDAIASFLALDSRLEESYSLFAHSGHQGWGDDSDAIRAGRVLRDQQPREAAEINDELLARASRAYEDCSQVFEQRRWTQKDWLGRSRELPVNV